MDCTVYASSGTALQIKSATVYEVFKAGASKTVARLDMGALHPQAATVSCTPADFTTV
jgi:hypothetical protein